jgi:hypothetical protein
MITLDRPLSRYHWGAAESTAAQYSGVDMRGEVKDTTLGFGVLDFYVHNAAADHGRETTNVYQGLIPSLFYNYT